VNRRNHGTSGSRTAPLPERVAPLQDLTLFADLSSADSATVYSAANAKRFWRRQMLYCEGDAIKHVMLLLSGCVKVTQLSWKGDEVILRLNAKGDLLSETHQSAGYRHCSGAQAIQPGVALVWQLGVFERLFDSLPAFRRNVVGALEERLREMEQRFREVSSEDVASRLCSELIRLTTRLADSNPEKEILISRKELAQLTGTSLFTVSRLLSRWQEMGIVRIRREAVQVCDPHALARFVVGK
jgi:CRP/FNR family transcriptional regulator, nitrogen oxide reductase regulator